MCAEPITSYVVIVSGIELAINSKVEEINYTLAVVLFKRYTSY